MGKNSSWAAVFISMLLLFGGGVASYTSVKSEMAVLQEKVGAREAKDVELDYYDAYITADIDKIKERLTRTEAAQEAIRENQERLEFTMGEILKEMKKMNENIIRLGVK